MEAGRHRGECRPDGNVADSLEENDDMALARHGVVFLDVGGNILVLPYYLR